MGVCVCDEVVSLEKRKCLPADGMQSIYSAYLVLITGCGGNKIVVFIVTVYVLSKSNSFFLHYLVLIPVRTIHCLPQSRLVRGLLKWSRSTKPRLTFVIDNTAFVPRTTSPARHNLGRKHPSVPLNTLPLSLLEGLKVPNIPNDLLALLPQLVELLLDTLQLLQLPLELGVQDLGAGTNFLLGRKAPAVVILGHVLLLQAAGVVPVRLVGLLLDVGQHAIPVLEGIAGAVEDALAGRAVGDVDLGLFLLAH